MKIVSKPVVLLLLCRSVDCSRKPGLGRCRGACLIGTVGLLTGRGLTEHNVHDPRFKHCFAIPLASTVFLLFCHSQPHDVPLIAIMEAFHSQQFIFVMFLLVFCCLTEVQMSFAAQMVYYS